MAKQKKDFYENLVAKLITIDSGNDNWKLSRKTWFSPSAEELDFKPGDRVWPAGEKYNEYFELKEKKEPGTQFYPDGAYICINNKGTKRVFDLDSIIKHPKK